jgi:hypothetical protein
VVERLLCEHEALSSKHRPTNKKEKREEERGRKREEGRSGGREGGKEGSHPSSRPFLICRVPAESLRVTSCS